MNAIIKSEQNLQPTNQITPSFQIITREMISSLQKTKKEVRKKKTKKDAIFKREGGKGKVFDYVKRSAAIDALNEHYPINSFSIMQVFKNTDGSCEIVGRLDFIDPDTGIPMHVDEIGSYKPLGDREKVPNMELKAARTDCFKRCLAAIGFFSDVYGDGIDEEGTTVPEEDLSWFLEKVLPLILSRYEASIIPVKNVFDIITKFTFGSLTKDFIKKQNPA